MEPWGAQMSKIKFNNVYKFNLTGTFGFGNLTTEALVEIFKDGRVASHLLEPQLVTWFPELKHIKGCKDHDHVNRDDENIKYDAKNFTTASGCKFMPSGMIGTGRKFDEKQFLFKTENMNYIICDIVDFPKVNVVFKKGQDLSIQYPNGCITKTKRQELFGAEAA
jgi:hypothetical protein